MKPILLTTVVLVATLASGLIQGKLSNRFGHPASRVTAAERLAELPTTDIGEWKMKNEGELKPAVTRILECAGSIVRTYTHQSTGETVDIAIIIGPPQPTVIHTPEICYNSRNHKLDGARGKDRITGGDGSEDEFWRSKFKSRELEGGSFSVYYSWTTGRDWIAESKSARYRYAWHPYLYKIQVASKPRPEMSGDDEDPCQLFLVEFLPVLKKHLQPQD